MPLTWAAREADNQTPNQPDNSADTEPYTRAFETALAAIEVAHASEVAALREQITAADRERIGLKAMVEQFAGAVRDAEEAARVERACSTDEIAGERSRADALRDRLDDVQRDLKASEAIARELRADLDAARAQAQATQEVADAQARLMAACRSRGLLARLRAAVRGE